MLPGSATGASAIQAAFWQPRCPERSDSFLAQHFANALVQCVGDVELAVRRERDAERLVEKGFRRGGAVPARARNTAMSGRGTDGAVGVDTAHAVVAAIGDEELAVRRPRHVGGVEELCGAGRTAVAVETGRARAGGGFD